MVRGTWHNDLKFGSTIPANILFFDQQGRCYINEGTACIDYADTEELRQPNILAFTSEAHRVYTLFFTKNGVPNLEHDDF